MLRLLSRFVGYWIVAAALVVAVVDGAKSIAASTLVVTPLAETWATLASFASPAAEPGGAGLAEAPASWPLDAGGAWLLGAPTVLVLGVIGFLLLAAGRRRRRPALGREFAA